MDRRIEKAFDIIKKKYGEKILLEDLAASCKLSPFHFQRLFKKEMGETPANCLSRIRLERSAHLLKVNNRLSISDIAADCGFSSVAAFSRAFSKKFEISPSQFREDTSTSMKIIVVKSGKKKPEVEVVYVPDTYVLYKQTALYNSDLLAEFESVQAFCEHKKIKFDDRKIGIATHVTFHYPENKLNYYAGIPVSKTVAELYPEKIFFIPKGKYSRFVTEESIRHVQEIGMWHHLFWMPTSGYVRRDLFSFEEIDPENKRSDYPELRRAIYVPIKKA